MKAKYILEAIRIMRVAEELNYSTDPKVFGHIRAALFIARLDLELQSGLFKVEVPIEDSAQNTAQNTAQNS